MAKRDDFIKDIKERAAKRVAYRCSFPGCGVATVGPEYGNSLGVSNVGVACHICAAAPGGPRYDENMSSEQRKSIENCIWMCATHSVIIDSDEKKYSVELLKLWKAQAENNAAEIFSAFMTMREALSRDHSRGFITLLNLSTR